MRPGLKSRDRLPSQHTELPRLCSWGTAHTPQILVSNACKVRVLYHLAMTGQPGHSHGCLTPSSAETSAQGSASSPRLNRPYPPHPMRAPWKDTSDISLNSWQKWTHDLTMKMNRIPSLQFGTPGLFQRASCSRIQKEPLRRTQILAVIPYSENLELWRLLTNTDLKLTYVSFLGALSANSGHQEGLAHHIFPTLFFLSQVLGLGDSSSVCLSPVISLFSILAWHSLP